jgi:F-type H+-transporting ATPase subunit alpha
MFAGTKGFLDELPLNVLAKYEAGLYQFIESRYPQIFSGIAEEKKISDDMEQLMNKALAEYGDEFKDTIK